MIFVVAPVTAKLPETALSSVVSGGSFGTIGATGDMIAGMTGVGVGEAGGGNLLYASKHHVYRISRE
jgi:hypothetical protein